MSVTGDRGAERTPTTDASLRDRFVELLIARVANDHYPSATMMDQIERSMTRQLHDRYVEVLLQKIADDRYPSPDLTRRIALLVW